MAKTSVQKPESQVFNHQLRSTGVTRAELKALIYESVDGNGMGEASNVHIRLMVTRGLKPTPYQSPYITIGEPSLFEQPPCDVG